ncbi:hypothetical protein F6X51_24320 [Methylobacterium planeticum]|uniref:Uncharacterized protein n=1 Tax=Methylobacterium planeticum TaxID=2615211 RepID=A0A6N6MNI7_9HYPH|nr:hypothetical protein F6X51_24320 [Methylobacterium planeticum]
MKFDPAEMAHLRDLHCLTTDALGHLVYAGLTQPESEEYFALTRENGSDRREGETSLALNARRARYLALHHRMREAQIKARATSAAAQAPDTP